MGRTIRSSLRSATNSLLSLVDMELRRHSHNWDDPKTYIPLKETLARAKEARLSVGDYIEARYNVPGATQETIDQMTRLGVFNKSIERICEIGPGSGRYLVRTLQACNPAYYEIYETAHGWAKWLAHTYNVVYLPTDGLSLASTPSNSIDLVHAHKVFFTTSFLTTYSYFGEMARVVRNSGQIVFDIMTEACVDESTLDKFLSSGVPWLNTMIPKQFAIDFFFKRGFSLNGNFLIATKPGVTEYLVFTR